MKKYAEEDIHCSIIYYNENVEIAEWLKLERY